MKQHDPLETDYSILILLEEDSDGFSDYVNRLYKSFKQKGYNFEIIILANGTELFLKSQIPMIVDSEGSIRAFCFNNKTTQAVCLKAGLNECKGQKIIACGSYQQISIESLFNLVDALNEDVDIVCPWRTNRVDPKLNQIQSRFFNKIAKTVLDTPLNDLSCNVRIFHRYVLEDVNIYGNMYRFLPIIAAQKGYSTIELKCDHFEERGDTGIYDLSEYVVRIIDILTIYFNSKFIRKPLRFFMRMGVIFLSISFVLISYVLFEKLFFSVLIGDRITLLLSFFLMNLGVQIASVGLLGEIISFTLGRNRHEYQIAEKYNMIN